MRYWGILASFLIAAPVQAAPVSFAIDLLFPPINGTGDPFEAGGPQPGAGAIHFDDTLLNGADAFVPFSQITSFNLNLMVSTFNNDGMLVVTPAFTTSFGLETFRGANSSCTGAPDCGLLFSGTSFQGFQGRFVSDTTPSFGISFIDRLTFFDSSIAFEDGVQGLGQGLVSLRYESGSLAPVPEPSSWAMIGVCGLMVGWASRKRLRAGGERGQV